jgi:hypothetical protein
MNEFQYDMTRYATLGFMIMLMCFTLYIILDTAPMKQTMHLRHHIIEEP